jgi:predicted amidohydrolase YtcJ
MRLLLDNARLFDPRSGLRRPGALLVEEGRIARLLPPGSPVEAPRVDCGGRRLTPGIFDAHVHLVFGGEALGRLEAARFPARADLLAEVARRARAAATEPGRRAGWVLGQGLIPGPQLPTLAELDEASGAVPVCLDTHDLHSCLVNSAALALAGVDARRDDPSGGEIGRDDAGRPNGLLRENAALWMRPVIPPAGDEERLGFILAAQAHANALGVTGVGENLRRVDLPLFQRLEREGRLTLRVQGWRNDGNLAPDTFELEPFLSPRLRVDTLKLFVDGALGSRSAAFSSPYLDGSRGVLVAAPEDLLHWMRRGLERGWRLALHAIGDLAVARALDFFAELGREGLPVAGWRHRIEHAQFVQPADIARFRQLEIVPSVQPLHCATDQDGFTERLWAHQVEIAFPWRSFLAAGAPLPIGTDWPVEPLDPRLNLYHGVTRRSRAGLELIGGREALGVPELLRGMTWEAAHAAGWGEELGQLAPGAHADLLLWEDDPLEAAAERLPNLALRAVWSGGALVHGNAP